MYVKYSVKFLIGVLIDLFVRVESQTTVGDSCILANTKQGSCQLLLDCEPAWKDLLEKDIYPQVCGHLGTVLIACCPVLQAKRSVGEISKQKCKEYAKAIYYKISNPAHLFGHDDDKVITQEDCRIVVKTLVIGGEKANEAEFPHMAQIGYSGQNELDGEDKQWLCGGSLISEQFVLTAGHCLYLSGSPKYVRIGITNIHDTNYLQEFNIIERIKHPEYEPPSHYNDIALVKMDRPGVFKPQVRPACLFTEDYIQNRKAIATGWGRRGYMGDFPEDLQKVVLDFIDLDRCNRSYKRFIGEKLTNGIVGGIQICAGTYKETRDTCQGDSGGPLQISNTKLDDYYCTYSVVGVTSFGKPCGVVNTPGIYTKVSAHLEWIENVVWPQ